MYVKCNDLRNEKELCFANRFGECMCLAETFARRCPFYKTAQQAKEDEAKARKRLQSLERHEL